MPDINSLDLSKITPIVNPDGTTTLPVTLTPELLVAMKAQSDADLASAKGNVADLEQQATDLDAAVAKARVNLSAVQANNDALASWIATNKPSNA